MGSKGKRQFLMRAGVGALLLAGAVWPLLAAGALPLGTLTYRETEGGAVTTHVIRVEAAEDGLRVELSSERPAGTVRQSLRVAGDLSTRAWTFSDPSRRMELTASVQGERIVLTGSSQGKKVDKRFDATGAPWNQLFQMGLGPFVMSGRKEMTFRSIGTQGPGELKIGKMSVTRRGEEEVEINGQKVAVIHVRISLSGLLSIFWHGDYWYRKSDGLFLRYRGKNRRGGAIAVSELAEEKRHEAAE
jgi:hypothetical protein